MSQHAEKKRKRIITLVVAVCVVALFGAALRFAPLDAWKAWIQSLPPLALFLAFALLPLTGFPVTLVLVATGMRFGFWPGLGATAVAIGIHLLLSYHLAGFVRRPVNMLLRRAGWEIPTLDNRSAWPFSTWLALAPGLSYTLKNYIPSLAGVPLGIFLATYYPAHLATGVIGLLLGGVATRFSWPLAAGVVAYMVLMAVLTRVLARRFRRLSEAAPARSSAPALCERAG